MCPIQYNLCSPDRMSQAYFQLERIEIVSTLMLNESSANLSDLWPHHELNTICPYKGPIVNCFQSLSLNTV